MFDIDHQPLARTINGVGVTVQVDPLECRLSRAAGWIEMGKLNIAICTDNSPDREVWHDTLRHEGVHLAQACYGYVSGTGDFEAIHPEAVNEGSIQYHRELRLYSEDDHDIEAEAWFIAGLDNPDLVNTMIRHHCSFAF